MQLVPLRNGFKADEPCLFVLEGSLYNFEDKEAASLLQSLPRKNPQNVVVCTTFQARMLRWVNDARNQKNMPFLAGLVGALYKSNSAVDKRLGVSTLDMYA
jgi:O-methyltransferase involved in polyketide biosynthesis